MTKIGHLWALGYDDMGRAEQVREKFVRLGEKGCLILLNTAVAVRFPDGSVTLEGEAFVDIPRIQPRTFAGFLAGLALGAPPLTGAAAGAFLRGVGVPASAGTGIDEEFVCEVERLMKPGASALFILDQEGDLDAILQGIKGLGGTVLKTNVDLERAGLIQSTLLDASRAFPSGEDQQ
jgi:uncharacterized membrane protein